jgi:hypothetical protein
MSEILRCLSNDLMNVQICAQFSTPQISKSERIGSHGCCKKSGGGNETVFHKLMYSVLYGYTSSGK